jgi:hypothetical protein
MDIGLIFFSFELPYQALIGVFLFFNRLAPAFQGG